MNLQRRRVVLAAVVLGALLFAPVNIFSCGPFFEEPVFTRTDYPDEPLELFAKGRLGIVLPEYERQYLVVAYRYLAGPPLSRAEMAALEKAWGFTPEPAGPGSKEEDPTLKWQQARAAALGPKGAMSPEIVPWKQVPNGWESYANCGADAFLTAAQTAATLVKTFGAGSEAVRDWVQGQDMVFENCGGRASESGPQIPQPLGVQNAILRMERDYQVGAAYFYSGNWQTAAQQFQQIAGDHESPWRIWAPYLVARCYLRQATLGSNGENRFDVHDMTEAEQRLQAILKDPALEKVHPAAQRLLNYVEGRLHPDQRLYEVAQQLSGRASVDDFSQDLTDFDWLMRRQMNQPEMDTAQGRDSLTQRGLLDDLTDWVLTFSRQTPDSLLHAVERWRSTKSEAWLVAALSLVRAKDGSAAELEQAAEAVATSSPAYEMAIFHRTRLLIEGSDKKAARQLLDANLKRFEKGPLSSYNLLLGERFELATDLPEFLQFAPRTPVELAYYTGDELEGEDVGKPETELPRLFSADSTRIMNARFPLTLLTRAATSGVLPMNLGSEVGTATWTRAAILGATRAAKAVEDMAVAAHPELRDYVAAYDKATSPDAQTFAATWTMLHFPGMQPMIVAGLPRRTKFADIDDFRANWWCADPISLENRPAGLVFYGDSTVPVDPVTHKPVPPVLPASPAFLSAVERAAADKQREDLSRMGAAPDYFGQIVLQWAKTHPADERVPEALYLEVRASRYGCTDEKTGTFSKAAFDLLHTRYADSPWTKKTPYWFK